MEDLKKEIITFLIDAKKEELLLAQEAFKSTHSLVKSPELKAEGKYDTRAIEAGYLAGAQKRRVDQIRGELERLKNFNNFGPHQRVAMGSLVEVMINERTKKQYFINISPGGREIDILGQKVVVVSPESPIGNELIGLEEFESFEVSLKDEVKIYEIVSIS